MPRKVKTILIVLFTVQCLATAIAAPFVLIKDDAGKSAAANGGYTADGLIIDEDEEVPLGFYEEETGVQFSVMNGICAVLTLAGAFVITFARRREDEHSSRRMRIVFSVIGFALAAFSIIALIFTQSFSGEIGFADSWTIPLATVLAFVIAMYVTCVQSPYERVVPEGAEAGEIPMGPA